MEKQTQPSLKVCTHLLHTIEQDIFPLTEQGVLKGDKVFGAAVLTAESLTLVCASTNKEHSGQAPLWHGEMVAIADFYATQNRPQPNECLFLSTHEPCPMCAAAIAWAGFKEVYYLFDYHDTAKTFAIPHDINILHELFPPAKGLAYNNAFFRVHSIKSLVAENAELNVQIKQLVENYQQLSATYQSRKDSEFIQLK